MSPCDLLTHLFFCLVTNGVGAVHHWDENGLANSSAEPVEIRTIHEEEIEFVKAWLKDFNKLAVSK